MEAKVETDSSQTFMDEIMNWQDPLPERINACPTNVEKGMAKLVLTLIELLRKLMEKQAMKRVDQGSLTDEEIERIGETFIILEKKMLELREVFHLEDEELNIPLGPLGNLM